MTSRLLKFVKKSLTSSRGENVLAVRFVYLSTPFVMFLYESCSFLIIINSI